MNTADTIAEVEARAARAEAAALEFQIRLAVVRTKLAELEAAEAGRKDAEAERAVRQLVIRGAIRRDDNFAQHEMKAKFIADPALIPLAIGKPANQKRKRVTK